MDSSIIKTPRVSLQPVSLDLRRPNTSQTKSFQGNAGNTGKPPQKKSPPDASSEAQTSTAHIPTPSLADPLLSTTLRDKLITPPEKPTTSATSILTNEAQDDQRKKAEAIYEQARKTGYEAGEKEAQQKMRKELEDALAQIKTLFTHLQSTQEHLYEMMEDSAVEVVFTAIVKILGRAATDQQLVYNLVREAIEQVKDREQLTVRVSVKDYDIIKTALGHAEGSGLLPKNFEVVADKLVELGGCLIETDAGNLDARLEIQLQHLKETLLSTRHANS